MLIVPHFACTYDRMVELWSRVISVDRKDSAYSLGRMGCGLRPVVVLPVRTLGLHPGVIGHFNMGYITPCVLPPLLRDSDLDAGVFVCSDRRYIRCLAKDTGACRCATGR